MEDRSMNKCYLKINRRKLSLIFLCVSVASLHVAAQQPDVTKMRAEAKKLMDDIKYTEALPILEKIVLITPNDPEMQRDLGFALLAMSKNTSDPTEAKRLRARARVAFVKAKDAGDDSPLVNAGVNSIAPDGGESPTFSAQAAADTAMQKAEAAFASGKMDEALSYYQQALKLDPKLYEAALFSGDVYVQKEMYAEAETWYQRAIAIDPNIETAYRYSATPLMKQKKYELARDRYIEAWITAPYNNLALEGIVQWGQIMGMRLGHPKIDIPKITVGADGKYNANLTLSPDLADGSLAWGSYITTREDWRKEKFARAFPNEKAYRHTLAEEADALRSVIAAAKGLKPTKLNPQIELLSKLDQDGVLEAYILLARPDEGIAQDHPAYLRSNRDKLRLYVVKYIVGNK